MEITKRAANWTAPVGYAGDKVCDIKATHALTHSVSNRFGRKKAPAVAVCVTTLGCKLLAVRLAIVVLLTGCGTSQPTPPKPQSCGLLGDSCSSKTPCCRSVNGASIECLDGACEYK